jgi:NDP-hexose 4,6-dehydratase
MTDRVAVTGAEGFIGSHLVEALVRRGHRVRAMVLYNMFSSHGWLDVLDADIMDQVDVVFGNVCDPASVRQVVEGAAVVYHLAALGSVPYSYCAPRSFVDTNVIGTLHVLEAVRACRTPRLVHTSTSETYGTARTVPISEAHVLQAQSPYAASKVAADKLVESYPGDHHPARGGFPPAQAGCARPDPRLHIRHRHRAGVRGPGRGPCFRGGW